LFEGFIFIQKFIKLGASGRRLLPNFIPLPLLKVLRVNQATPALTLSMIARLVDPEKLEELIFNLKIKSAISNDSKDWLKLLLKYLKRLKNLTNVQTNLFYCISLRQFKNFRRR